MGLSIASAARGDAAGVIALSRDAYEEASTDPSFGDYLFNRMPSRQRMKRWFDSLRDEAARGDAVYCVAKVDGTVAGHCFVRRDTPGSELSHVGVMGILVGRSYRNTGIGARLLGYTIRRCKGRFEILHLRVFSSNSVAKKLYRKFGFRPFGVAPGFAKRRGKYLDREFMYLDLRS